MMDARVIPEVGLMFSGHDADPDEVAQAALDWLTERGVNAWGLRDARKAMERDEPQQAWWGGDDVGFCSPDNPDLTPVPMTVVHLPKNLLGGE